MMPEPILTSPESLSGVLTALMEALEQGQAPDRGAWTNRYPRFAAELEEFFTSRELFEPWAAPLRSVARALAPAPWPQDSQAPGSDDRAALDRFPGSLPDYELLAEIGKGGMGVVYQARQKSLNRLVALKMIRAGALAPEDNLRRFRNEAEAVAHLDHAHIVPVHEIGQYAGHCYFTMKLIEGDSLDRQLARFSAEPKAAARLLAAVARAVHHAHQRGILHRDLKPGNILVDADGQPHVTDFGLAKRVEVDSSLTQSGALIGTPSYMAPEQTTGIRGAVTTATDVYGLGAVLYAMLTGRAPFRGDHVLETLRQVREQEPESPSAINPRIDRDLATITLKCLRKEPEQRYASAAALAEDLEHWLKGEPIQARPLAWAARWRRWCRRNPLVASLTATAAVLVLLLVAALAVGLAVISHKEQDTRAALQAAEVREAETKAVMDFVEDKVFSAGRPVEEGGLGYQVTLRQAVEQALPFVEKSFADQPLIEARLRLTLGLSFLNLGDAKVAAEQFQAARTLYTKHKGPDHPDTLSSMTNLANSYAALGRHTDALKFNAETLARRKAKLGPDHSDTLASMNNLANSFAAFGRHADALKLREETLALMKAKLGPDHPDRLSSMHNLALSYGALGRHADALKLHEETLALRKVKLGPDHPHTLSSMYNLACTYTALGRQADALKLDEETLELRKAKLGSDHPDTLMSMYSLAIDYTDLGRHTDALKLNEETLALRKAKLGPDHPDTLSSMHNLALSYGTVGRHADALKLNEETLALRKAKLGPDHPDRLSSMHNLAFSYGALGRHADALKLNEETLALRKVKLGPDHRDTLKSMNNLANSFAAFGRHAHSRKLREETLALQKVKLGPDHPDTLLTMGGLAQSLLKLERGAEAVPLIDECVKRTAGQVVHPQFITRVVDLRLRHFEKTKDAAGCRQTAELWEQLKRTDAGSLYDAACMRAVTAAVLRGTDLKSVPQTKEAAAEADRAMAWLTQAVAAGYKNAAHMKKDTDLDALRDRPDFKKLLESLEELRKRAGKKL